MNSNDRARSRVRGIIDALAEHGLAVRPEHFVLADDGAQAEILVIEPTGSEILVAAKMGGEDIVAVFRERHQFKPGEKIRLKPDPALVHLFDDATGKRLNA